MDNALIIELDTTVSREELLRVFEDLNLEKMNYNGGIYVACFNHQTPFHQVVYALGKAEVSFTYIRNISASTRRFFMN